MPAFEYVSLDEKGKKKKGVLEADSARLVRQQLAEKGWMPLEVKASVNKESTKPALFQAKAGLAPLELALITRQLATLIQAGIPIEETLNAIAKQSDKRSVQLVILAVRAKLMEGHALASALGDFPGSFPELYRATVAAGEKSGHLDLVMEQLADYTESRFETMSKIRNAMIYPGFLFSFSILIVWALLTFAVPKVVGVFENSGRELPFITQALIAVSDWVVAWWWLAAMIAIGGALLFKRALGNSEFRYKVHKFTISAPVVGRFVKMSDGSRMASTLGILARSGVPLVESLHIAAAVVSNLLVRDAVKLAANKVQEGGSLNKSLASSKFFSPMMLQMIASGERSGELETMLNRAADSQEKDLERQISTFTQLFGPITLVLMAAVVFVIVLAMILPIVSMNQLVL